MSLPRHEPSEEELDQAVTMRLSAPELDALDDDDTTTPVPARFLLKLPESFAERLAAAAQPPAAPTALSTPSTPWTVDTTRVNLLRLRQKREPAWSLVAFVASVVLGATFVAGVGRAAAASSDDGPVGIATHAPKTLEKSVRTFEWRTGFAPEIATVSIESLARPRARPRRR